VKKPLTTASTPAAYAIRSTQQQWRTSTQRRRCGQTHIRAEAHDILKLEALGIGDVERPGPASAGLPPAPIRTGAMQATTRSSSPVARNEPARVGPPSGRTALGQAKRRAFAPEEAGRLLAACPLFWWDHVLTLLGTGLRFGELAGLRCRRIPLEAEPAVLQVVDVRYQAGRFGSGFKSRPKSDAGIREVPLAPLWSRRSAASSRPAPTLMCWCSPARAAATT
jgi:integrase